MLEEMRRVPWYMKWKARWWINQAGGRDVDPVPPLKATSPLLKAGCRAYAAKQAYIWLSLEEKFRDIWTPLLIEYKFSVEWPQ